MSNRRLAPAEIQPAAFALSPESEAWTARQIQKYPPERQISAVIPVLWQVQAQCGGWLPQKAMEAVADRLGMPYIRVLEVATFYTMFNLEPVGRYLVQLCGTVPCHVKGALELKEALRARVGHEGEVSADGNFSWREVECLGACCNAPMVQINNDYYEDLTPEILVRILDDLAAGREVKPGPQQGRVSSEPEGGAQTLTDPSLFDGSVVGAWRKRFEEEDVKAPGAAEAATTDARAASEPKIAKPDAGRATERAVANGPAQRVAGGEAPVHPAERKGAADPSRATVVPSETRPETVPAPQSDKSYVATPGKPEEGRPVAGVPGGTTPVSGTPPSQDPPRRDGTEAKPVGSDPTDKAPPHAPGRVRDE